METDGIVCEILEITREKIRFTLSNCDVSLANALRRVMIAEVPTMAIHMVNIYENTSVLHDEFLTQRLGLIPFVSDAVDRYKYTWDCDCGENTNQCQICKAYFILQVKNEDTQIREVNSPKLNSAILYNYDMYDIRPLFENSLIDSEDSKPVEPVVYYSDIQKDVKLGIPIVKLSQNQQIDVRFDVEKGIGKMHSKWCPVSVATFHPEPEVKLDEEKLLRTDREIKAKIRDSCPTGVFELRQDFLDVARPEKCIFCEECKKVAEEHKLFNLIKINKKRDKFVFTVEGTGVLPPVSIVKKSIQILRTKLKGLESKIV